ncbi:hypothetical protein MNV49_003041 [Pseudohyphozyma bogoriensis]|nr:hypothetical protein MNV49_003041 [Pseudohyphozyma bogoriensis]
MAVLNRDGYIPMNKDSPAVVQEMKEIQERGLCDCSNCDPVGAAKVLEALPCITNNNFYTIASLSASLPKIEPPSPPSPQHPSPPIAAIFPTAPALTRIDVTTLQRALEACLTTPISLLPLQTSACPLQGFVAPLAKKVAGVGWELEGKEEVGHVVGGQGLYKSMVQEVWEEVKEWKDGVRKAWTEKEKKKAGAKGKQPVAVKMEGQKRDRDLRSDDGSSQPKKGSQKRKKMALQDMTNVAP